jgi:DNA-binding response OmpR family regulator
LTVFSSKAQVEFDQWSRSHIDHEAAIDLSGLHILLVEDAWEIGESLKMLLESMGAKVSGPAATTSEAEHLLEECIPHAAIVDLSLRGGERSDDLIDRLNFLGTSVIVASGYNVRTAQGKNVTAILEKPFTDGQLLAALRPLMPPKP